MELPDGEVERVLDAWPVARLATCGPDGPHQVPVVFARAGGDLWSPIDAKPKRGGELARVRHVRRDPRVSLLLDHYAEDWTRLWWVRVDASARVVEGADSGSDPQRAAALAALRRKYPQYGSVALLREPATVLRFEPLRVRSWCASRDAVPQA